ncbi:hypothetical protein PTI98_010401 [Pleurotus ostreatus]|nr:hypothetical protein PTI98_010401 [Pleurotus ostreatus]
MTRTVHTACSDYCMQCMSQLGILKSLRRPNMKMQYVQNIQVPNNTILGPADSVPIHLLTIADEQLAGR